MGTLLASKTSKDGSLSQSTGTLVYTSFSMEIEVPGTSRALARTAGEDLGDGQSLSGRIIAVAGPVTWITIAYSQT